MYLNFLSLNNSKTYRKNRVYMRRKKQCIFDKETKRLSLEPKLNLNLIKLNQDNRKLIRFIYKSLLRNQQKSFKQVPSINSLSGYQENLPNLKVSLVEELDRFSCIFVDDKPQPNQKKQTQPFEEKRIKMEQINELYAKKVEPIQKELMPIWSNVESEERIGIIDLYNRWQNSLENNFNNLKLKHKTIKPVFINYTKIVQKGAFNFELNLNNLKKVQIEIFDMSSEQNDGEKVVKIRPNTRILLKCFKEFMNSFDSIEMARQNMSTNSYWSNLKSFLTHLSKSILRCVFYVHENANLYKAPVGLPPIYVLESDDIKDEIIIKLESLYHYVFLCVNQLNVKVGKDYPETKEKNGFISTMSKRERKFLSKNNKQKYYKLILKSLMRLIQLCYYIRESIIMKQIRFESDSLTECDLYSHFVSNECNHIKEYLKEIILNKI
ncbi:hypothetical protein BpHYR1_006230 [Brachionus plicatilis]|uniref:Uncharacterized protein n=1 Tax=Brachionus plicatilis TaxID=10195 RepID=A0A3M7S880_BRAPC|nr:hypothetical protein BpHYR1_006230 [Brachionus plicatilis]